MALAGIREAGAALPNQSYLVRALQVQDAKQSSEIENIITTNDDLSRGLDTEVTADSATREVLRHTDALWAGYRAIRECKPISPSVNLDIAGEVKFKRIRFRAKPGTLVADAASGRLR